MVEFRLPSLHSFIALGLSFGVLLASAYDASRSDNLVVYYGQNSYGATHLSDSANWQKPLSTYCEDDTINAIPIAFVNVFFSTGGLPEISLANTCNPSDSGVFSGTNLANCQFLAADIQACQAKGKIVTISLGGGDASAAFSSDSQAEQFADSIWNLFLGGQSSTRPFGSAVLDGVDLDIEGGGSTGYAAFVTRIRSHASGANKSYYVTAAPQCPFPDAYLGSVINAVGFDAIYVQFYNNFCGLPNYNNPNAWDYSAWDSWAKNTSPNKNVKVFIGAPASDTAATSGYVDPSTLINIATQIQSQYSSFGGIMLWDASQAYANGRYDLTVKNGIAGGVGGGGATGTTTTSATSETTSSITSTTSTTTTTSRGSGSCAGVAAWQSNAAYSTGNQVVYKGHLWTAKWWSFGDIPGGSAGDWTDDGACSGHVAAVVTAKTTSQTAAISATATSSAKSTSIAQTISKAKSAAHQPSATAGAPISNLTSQRRRSRFFRL